MSGFIKVYRSFLDTVLLKNPAMLQVWMFLSEQAQYKKTVKHGIELLPGQLLTTVAEIARVCDLKDDKVRYVLGCLEEKGLIRRQNIRNRCTLITVLAPSDAQTSDERPEAVVTVQTEASQLSENAAKSCFGLCDNVYLTAEENRILHQRSAVADSYIDNLSAYKRRTRKTYTDDFSVLCEWISKDDISEKRAAARQAAEQLRREKERSVKEAATQPKQVSGDCPASTASYDLEAAERAARENVPVLRKRRR